MNPWGIKDGLGDTVFWPQIESVLGLMAAHFRSCDQQECSPLWPSSAASQLWCFCGSAVPVPPCLLLSACFMKQHLCSAFSGQSYQFDLISGTPPRNCTSLCLRAWPRLRILYFFGPDEAEPQTKCLYLCSHYPLCVNNLILFSRARPWREWWEASRCPPRQQMSWSSLRVALWKDM